MSAMIGYIGSIPVKLFLLEIYWSQKNKTRKNILGKLIRLNSLVNLILKIGTYFWMKKFTISAFIFLEIWCLTSISEIILFFSDNILFHNTNDLICGVLKS